MKKWLLGITLVLFAATLTIAYLLHKRHIWFVYPDKNIYSVSGLDVSHHQGKIDWEKVDRKYQFVFIKATEANTFRDKNFHENAKNVKATQRILGAYHFFHFNYGGLEQANNFINAAGDLIDLPPAVDFEFTGNPKDYEKQNLLNELRICVETLEKHYGHKAIIYVTKDSYKHIVKDNFDNSIWYRSIILPVNKKIKNVIFWQYHNSAIIDGIGTKVDLNVFKGDIAELETYIMK
jgi:lysozyme